MTRTILSVTSIFIMLIISTSAAFADTYNNKKLGVSFSHPSNVKLDSANINKNPLKIPFTYGEPPFTVSVLLKDTGMNGSLKSFLNKEHMRQKAGGYAGQVAQKMHKTASGTNAVELIRKTPAGTIYQYVFEAPKGDRILALWLMSSDMADPNGEAIKAYQMMRSTLNVN